jgi:hypothetical protein
MEIVIVDVMALAGRFQRLLRLPLQDVGITVNTQCSFLLVHCLHVHEAMFTLPLNFVCFMQFMRFAVAFSSTFGYIDDVLFINNDQYHSWGMFIHLVPALGRVVSCLSNLVEQFRYKKRP